MQYQKKSTKNIWNEFPKKNRIFYTYIPYDKFASLYKY